MCLLPDLQLSRVCFGHSLSVSFSFSQSECLCLFLVLFWLQVSVSVPVSVFECWLASVPVAATVSSSKSDSVPLLSLFF